jgi:hypothetical protein
MQAVSRIPQLTPLSPPHSYTPVLSTPPTYKTLTGFPLVSSEFPVPTDALPHPRAPDLWDQGHPPLFDRPPPPPTPQICGILQSVPGSTPPFPPSYPGFPHFFLKEHPIPLYMSHVYISSRPETNHRTQLYTTMAHTATTLKPPPP